MLTLIVYNILVVIYFKMTIEDYISCHGGEKDYMNTASSFIISGIVTIIVLMIDWIIIKTKPIKVQHSA